MLRNDAFKPAGDIIREGLDKTSSSKESGVWARLALAVKLSELCACWEEIAGNPLSKKSAPASCECKDGAIRVTVNVSESSVLAAAKFRRARVERNLRLFLRIDDVKVEFRVGPAYPPSAAAQPLPLYKRRAPVTLADADVEEEKRKFQESGMSEGLAREMARVKLSIEKLAKRRNGG